MLVKDVMSKEVRTVRPDDLVRQAATIICTTETSALPVTDDQNNMIGVIAEKDILHALLPNYSDFLEDPVRAKNFEAMEESYNDVLGKQVKELMTAKPHAVSPDDPMLMAASRMTLLRFRRMPVVEQGKLVGMVSLRDIHKSIFKKELGL